MQNDSIVISAKLLPNNERKKNWQNDEDEAEKNDRQQNKIDWNLSVIHLSNIGAVGPT